MRRLLILLVCFSLVLPSPSYAGGFFGLFGGRRRQAVQVQQPYYQQQYYQQQYYQPYQAVAAIPLATIPVAVDLQAYQYSVNAGAFQSFREYMASKGTASADAQVQQSQPAESPPVTPRSVASPEETRLLGAQVLKKNCIGCHQEGRNPKKGFAIFDKKGDMFTSLPYDEMLERISSNDPEVRMPPKKQLATSDVLAVFRMVHAAAPVEQPTNVASATPWSPLD